MKLNNRGWGLQAMLAGVLILMIALVIISVLVQKTFDNIVPENNSNKNEINNKVEDDKNNYTTYAEIEKDIVEAAKKYQKKYYNNILDGEKISVTLKNLQEEKLISDIKDIKNKNISCSGYAIFISDNNNILYSSYIKCGDNYETVGYQEFYDVQF